MRTILRNKHVSDFEEFLRSIQDGYLLCYKADTDHSICIVLASIICGSRYILHGLAVHNNNII